MAAKAILILCAQALLTQCAISHRVCRGVGAPFNLGGQAWPYTGLMNDGLMTEPWSRGMAFDNFGYANPTMDFAASTMMPGYETMDPYMGEMPYLMDYGYNMPLVDPVPMVPEMPVMVDPMAMMPGPSMMMEPYPMYTDIPVMMDPIPPMINEGMIMEPMYPVMDPAYPITDPMYPIVDPIYPITDPMYPIITDPTCPMPMPVPVEEIVAPARGSPLIAPSASLSVVVMDSSIQNLFENLWNVNQ